MKKEQKVIRVYPNGGKSSLEDLNKLLDQGYNVVSVNNIVSDGYQTADYLIEKSEEITSEIDMREIILDCMKEINEEIKQSVEKFDLDSLSVLPNVPVKKEIKKSVKISGDPEKDGVHITDNGPKVFFNGHWFAYFASSGAFSKLSDASPFNPKFYYIDHE